MWNELKMIRKRMTRADLAVIGVALLVSILTAVLVWLPEKAPADCAKIYVGNVLVDTLPLSTDGEYTYEAADGWNTVRVSGGKVFVTDASCPDKSCVKQGKAANAGDTIICLPNALVIVTDAAKEAVLDAVSY